MATHINVSIRASERGVFQPLPRCEVEHFASFSSARCCTHNLCASDAIYVLCSLSFGTNRQTVCSASSASPRKNVCAAARDKGCFFRGKRARASCFVQLGCIPNSATQFLSPACIPSLIWSIILACHREPPLGAFYDLTRGRKVQFNYLKVPDDDFCVFFKSTCCVSPTYRI